MKHPPTTKRTLLLTLLGLSALGVSCGSYVTRGERLYQEGRYLESAEELARHENELRTESVSSQAQYATYRGLSNLVVGNFPEAHRWLRFAYQLERQFPGSLRSEQRAQLDRGWWELSKKMNVGGAAPGLTTSAASSER